MSLSEFRKQVLRGVGDPNDALAGKRQELELSMQKVSIRLLVREQS